MDLKSPHFTEAELHAYVDGQLPPDINARIESWLETEPEAAAQVAVWRAQNKELRALFAPYAVAETSASVQKLLSPAIPFWRQPAAMVASAALIFVFGAASGHYGSRVFTSTATETAQSLPRNAQDAYLIYASEVRHPVEVFAEDQAHLADWLGKRLESDDLRIPDLKSLGFSLVGGRLIPVDGKPGAMLMYEDSTGARVTIMVRRDSDNKTTSFRSASSGNLETFYWVDGSFGYAVTGEISRSLLQSIATESYQQFEA